MGVRHNKFKHHITWTILDSRRCSHYKRWLSLTMGNTHMQENILPHSSLRGSLHYGPWKMTFVNGPSSWLDFHGPTSQRISFESLGPLTWCKPNVDQEEWPCTREWMWRFFKNMPKKGNLWKKKKSLTILLSSLGVHLSSLLVKCVEDVAYKSSYNKFYKKEEESDLSCTCNIYLVLSLH